MKEIKEDEYSNSLTTILVCAMLNLCGRYSKKCFNQIKIIRLCMEAPCLCPSEGHEYGNRKLTKTCNLVLL